MKMKDKLERALHTRRFIRPVVGALLLAAPLASHAETLMMPDRDARAGVDVVVWGVTDQAGSYTLDCGNGAVFGPNPVTDGSYIAHICNYATENLFTATLTVGAEVGSADVAAFDYAALTDVDQRGLDINMAIEDGLRWLWTAQNSRAANFPSNPITTWGTSGWPAASSAIVTLAFQNQGYRIPADGSPPTGIYEKYAVQRGLNYVISNQTTLAIGLTPQGDDPCVGLAVDTCTGLYDRREDIFHQSYTTGVSLLAMSGSGAPAKVVAAADVPGNLSGGFVVGKTYGDILQRMTNAVSWGQIDAFDVKDRGGWFYDFNGSASDGSTIGWVLLGLLDAEAAGATVPQWVRDEFGSAGTGKPFVNLNNDGTIDYQANNNPASNSSVGPSKNGIGLQGLFFIGELAGVNVDQGKTVIDSWWNNGVGGIGGDSWGCQGAGPNHGCVYAMYNNFKGLKLHGVQTLPSVARPAGPGSIPAGDWHEDYKDWLLANQSAPNTVGGGSWGPAMRVSSQLNADMFETGVAELLLSPVVLVLPDPIQFGDIGLQHCLDGPACNDRIPLMVGDPTEDTNPVGEDHTVISVARSINGAPIPGTTININILSGPNAPLNFNAISNADGEVQFTYTSDGTAGTDELQANIGALLSNTVTKVWEAPAMGGPEACDINTDREITRGDIRLMSRMRGQVVDPAGGPGDFNSDGKVTGRDVKACIRFMGTVLP